MPDPVGDVLKKAEPKFPNTGPKKDVGPKKKQPKKSDGSPQEPQTTPQKSKAPTTSTPAESPAEQTPTSDTPSSAGDIELGTGGLGLAFDTQSGQLRVSGVEANQLGAQAGLQANDTILSVNGQQVTTPKEFLNQLQAGLQNGGMLQARVVRNGVQQNLRLDFSGLRYGFGFNDQGNSLQVTSVNNGSLADIAGLQEGDQVMSINGKPVTTASGLRAALRGGGNQTLTVRRNGRVETVRMNLEGPGAAGSLKTASAKAGQKLNQLRGQLSSLASQLPDGERLAGELDRLLTDLRGLDGGLESTDQTIAEGRKALRSLQDQVQRLASEAEEPLKGQLEGVRRGLLGMQTELDALSGAAKRVAREASNRIPAELKAQVQEASGTVSRLRELLNSMGRHQAGRVGQRIERLRLSCRPPQR